MRDASNICFICLKENTIVKEYKNDVKHIIELINYVLPQLINQDFGLPCICAQCYDICKVFHTFKKICFQNYGRWRDYISHLDSNDSLNKNELSDNSANLVDDIVVKEEIFEEDSIHLEPSENIKVENVDYENEYDHQNGRYSELQNVSECSFQVNFSENIQNEPPLFQISSVFSNADVNYFQTVDTHKLDDNYSDVNSLLIIKEKPIKKRKNKKSATSFTCSVCNKNFSQYRYMKQHMNIHKTDKNYKCAKCNKEFRQNYLLKRHMKSHSEEKEHECPICKKKYSLKFTLTSHMKTHENKELKCEICNKIFSHEDYLKRHMKIHSTNKEYKCQYCEDEFVYEKYLKQHVKDKHCEAAENF